MLSCVKEAVSGGNPGGEVIIRLSDCVSMETKSTRGTALPFTVESTPYGIATRAQALEGLTDGLAIFWSSTRGKAGHGETIAQESTVAEVSIGRDGTAYISTGLFHHNPPIPQNYHVSSIPVYFSATDGPYLICTGGMDVVSGTDAATILPDITLRHIFARTGAFRVNPPEGASVSDVRWQIRVADNATGGTSGKYRPSAETWNDTKGLEENLDVDGSSDMYLIPGTYLLGVSLTLSKGEWKQTLSRQGEIVLHEGHIHDITLELRSEPGFTIEMSSPEITMNIGESIAIGSELWSTLDGERVSRLDSDPSDFEWTSSSPDVLSVDADGVITGLKKSAGTVTITIRHKSTGTVAVCTVTVENGIVDHGWECTKPVFGMDEVADIPARGGVSVAPKVHGVHQERRPYTQYADGTREHDGPWEGFEVTAGCFAIEYSTDGDSWNAEWPVTECDDLGTEETARSRKASIRVRVVASGMESESRTAEIYQEANERTWDAPVIALSYAPAGWDSTDPMIPSVTVSQMATYTSGASEAKAVETAEGTWTWSHNNPDQFGFDPSTGTVTPKTKNTGSKARVTDVTLKLSLNGVESRITAAAVQMAASS